MDGANRQPSSLNQSTTARLYFGVTGAAGSGGSAGLLGEPAPGVQCGGDAVRAVVLPGGGLAVQMGAHHDVRCSGSPFDQGKEVADPVGFRAEAVLGREGGEPGPGLGVGGRGGLTVHAVPGGFADRREAAEIAEEGFGCGGWVGRARGGDGIGVGGCCGHGLDSWFCWGMADVGVEGDSRTAKAPVRGWVRASSLTRPRTAYQPAIRAGMMMTREPTV